MPLTPADIHNVEFAKTSLGRRGYDGEQVDALLDEVTQEMIRLLEENDALQHRHDAVTLPDGPNMADRAAEAELSAMAAELARAHHACERAQHNARLARRQLDQAYRSASATATTVHGARPTEGPVLMMAQRTADGYLHEAHESSRALLAEARERADRTVQEARQLVEAIDQQAQRDQDEASAQLAAKRTALLHDLDALTQFASEYHAALRRHLHRQGELIDGKAGSTTDQPLTSRGQE